MKQGSWIAVVALLCACSSGDDNRAGTSGPALQVTTTEFEQAYSCRSELAGITRDPVLITPAFSSDEGSFGWNYLRQLPALGIPVCSLSLPDGGFGDLQTAAEYVVHAVRRMHAESGRKVMLFGHQHGPLDELWALTFWPDLPAKVSSFISLATPYQGTTTARSTCGLTGYCPPSVWQIATGSDFLAALARQPLPAGPAYTSITTLYDELILPQPEASTLTGGTTIVLQDLCPRRPIEHFTILADNLSYLLVLDALAHPGAAPNPAHLPADVCDGPLYLPGIGEPQSAVSALSGVLGFLSGFAVAIPMQGVSAEPELRDYAK